jgi:hypothetical protein
MELGIPLEVEGADNDVDFEARLGNLTRFMI